MAREGVLLLSGKLNIAKLLDLLNAALSEEWLAYFQCWTAAKMVVGIQRPHLQKEFMLHASQEMEHASLICDRIIELEGVPVLSPADWFKHSNCQFTTPTEFGAEYYLRLLMSSEQCSMRCYQEIIEFTDGKDYVTNDMARKILAQETVHEQHMQDYLDDLFQIKKYIMGKEHMF